MKSKNYSIDHRFTMDVDQEQIVFRTPSGKEIATIRVLTVEKDGEPTKDFYLEFGPNDADAMGVSILVRGEE